MENADKEKFASMITGVLAVYGSKIDNMQLRIWWQALKNFDYRAVNQAFHQHVTDPDLGQWAPKPASIIRYLEGTTKQKAIATWDVIHQAIKTGSSKNVELLALDDVAKKTLRLAGYHAEINESDVQWIGKRFLELYSDIADYDSNVICIDFKKKNRKELTN